MEQEPRAGPHNPNPGPLAGHFLHITIKSWALSGNPQWYTEPHYPQWNNAPYPFPPGMVGTLPVIFLKLF